VGGLHLQSPGRFLQKDLRLAGELRERHCLSGLRSRIKGHFHGCGLKGLCEPASVVSGSQHQDPGHPLIQRSCKPEILYGFVPGSD
jgi:hypothetical protein